MSASIELTINGQKKNLSGDRERSLLAVLREDLDLTGSKFGCGLGQCGACTVLIDGKPARSCITTISSVENKSILTIEGLGKDGKLHPVQQAFIDAGAMQCGYCIPGMIMNAVGLLSEIPKPTREEIIQKMNGNICRCCTYPAILTAIERAAGIAGEAKK